MTSSPRYEMVTGDGIGGRRGWGVSRGGEGSVEQMPTIMVKSPWDTRHNYYRNMAIAVVHHENDVFNAKSLFDVIRHHSIDE